MAEEQRGPRLCHIAIDSDAAEAVQFSNGVIVAQWENAKQLYAWADLDALWEGLPGAVVTWLDDPPPGHGIEDVPTGDLL